MLRFRDLGVFVFGIWVLRASVFVFECFVFETTDLKSPKVAQSRLKSPKIALSRLRSPLVALSHFKSFKS